MSLALSPATEARIQAELATGSYAAPSELLDHALDLVEAERTGTRAIDQGMNDWLLQNKVHINSALDESFAAKDRGESFSPEEAEAILSDRRAACLQRAA